MNSLLLSIIFLLAFDFGQSFVIKFNEKLPSSAKKTYDQLCKVCGISAFSQPRIVEGNDTNDGLRPWMAAITPLGNRNKSFCGGVLITEQFILTSAQCLYEKSNSGQYGLIKMVSVELGKLDSFSTNSSIRQTYTATKLIPHTDYNPLDILRNNIGLIDLETTVKFTNGVCPICLPESPDYVEKDAIIIDGGNSPILRYTTNPIISNDLCSNYFIITEGNICQSILIIADKGDSGGGPLVIKGNVVGVVSFSESDAKFEQVSVYTRVDTFLPWIKQNAGME